MLIMCVVFCSISNAAFLSDQCNFSTCISSLFLSSCLLFAIKQSMSLKPTFQTNIYPSRTGHIINLKCCRHLSDISFCCQNCLSPNFFFVSFHSSFACILPKRQGHFHMLNVGSLALAKFCFLGFFNYRHCYP